MVTMQDIADHINVSRRTVSCVLSGNYKKSRISEATKDKIIIASEKLGYKRNALATAVKTGKTNVIGFIGGLYSSYCMEIIKGINDVVSKNNYMIKLLPTGTMEEVKNAARQCVEQRLAGVICRSLSEEGLEILHKELEPNNIPIVLVDSSFSHDWCSRVISDDFQGAKQAIKYLIGLGHSRIVHITNNLNRGFAKNRYDGYVEAMSEHNLVVQRGDVCITSDLDEITEIERNNIGKFLKLQKPTAIFCSSDPLAMKVINIAQSIGLKIPQNLSVVGFAGLNYTALLSPALTTVAQPFAEMGRKASEILLSEIRKKLIKQEVELPVKLIIRDSCREIS